MTSCFDRARRDACLRLPKYHDLGYVSQIVSIALGAMPACDVGFGQEGVSS